MNKKILAGIIIAVIVIGGVSFWAFSNSPKQEPLVPTQTPSNPVPRHIFLNLNESVGVAEHP